MRFNSFIIPTLFLTTTLLGCATDGLDDESTDDVVPSEAVALCLLVQNPPPSEHTFTFDPNDWPDIVQVHDYGNTECATFDSWYVNDGTVTAQVTQQTSDPDACVHTLINVAHWYHSSGDWIRAAPETIYGVWTATGCKLPKYHNFQAGDTRYSIRAARRTCAGQFCGWDYGFPFLQTGVADN